MTMPDTESSGASAEHTSKPFFSGPLGPDETQRLLDAIDARLRLLASLEYLEPGEVGRRDPLGDDTDTGAAAPMIEAGLDPRALENLAAPLFNVRHGGRAARAVRAMLNVPLRLFGRPQTYFNHEVRRVLASWAGVLQTRLDLQVTLERRIAMHMNRIERLAQRETQLEHAVVALRRLLDARDLPWARPPGAPPLS